MLKVLAIGAHPDDIELGCAGYLQKFKERYMLVLSNGENSINKHKLDRTVETKQAANLLSCNITISNCPDSRFNLLEVVAILENTIKTINPDIILTMPEFDVHQDHDLTYRATLIATRELNCTVLSYLTPSSAMKFLPNWFVELSDEEFNLKLKALNFHKSQLEKKYLAKEYIEGTARYWATVTKSDKNFIEPYVTIKHLIKNST